MSIPRWTGFFFLAVVATVAGWQFALAQVEQALAQRHDPGVYKSCHKIWSARGTYDGAVEQNTIEAFNRAFAHGASGAEVDVYFDVALGRFIVAHDDPTQRDRKERLLTLEALLDATDHSRYFWVDFKNLDRLSDTETMQAIRRLEAITRPAERHYLYLEGSNPLMVGKYTRAGFNTILAALAIPDDSFAAGFVSDINKLVYYFSDVTVLAFYQTRRGTPYFAEKLAEAYRNVPVFLFHVEDDPSAIDAFLPQQNIRVMLIGRDLSIERFELNHCPPREDASW